jgi:gliding motility-associated-like protein
VYTQSGTYSDTLTTAAGCDSIVSVNLNITGAIITPPITANACSSYTAPWGTVYTQSGTYSDTLTTAAGCDSIVSVNLNITGNPGFIPSTTADSCGNQTGTATLLGSGGTGPYSFAWSNGATGTILTNLSAGSYTVTITDQNGCSFDSVFSIPLLAPSPISLNIASISIVEGDSVQLNVSGANVYQWTPATGLSCSNCPNPIAAPLQTITYTVTGTDNNGCRTNATVFISVDIRCIELFIPTIFSPNNSGPGVNERICIYSNCIAELDFAIYDRWGKTIFQTNDPQQCWDGTKDGKQVMTGTYTYRLAARLLNGTNVNKSGNITLTR